MSLEACVLAAAEELRVCGPRRRRHVDLRPRDVDRPHGWATHRVVRNRCLETLRPPEGIQHDCECLPFVVEEQPQGGADSGFTGVKIVVSERIEGAAQRQSECKVPFLLWMPSGQASSALNGRPVQRYERLARERVTRW